jgi:hypothetical protein
MVRRRGGAAVATFPYRGGFSRDCTLLATTSHGMTTRLPSTG